MHGEEQQTYNIETTYLVWNDLVTLAQHGPFNHLMLGVAEKLKQAAIFMGRRQAEVGDFSIIAQGIEGFAKMTAAITITEDERIALCGTLCLLDLAGALPSQLEAIHKALHVLENDEEEN